jgi:hypothetical protein
MWAQRDVEAEVASSGGHSLGLNCRLFFSPILEYPRFYWSLCRPVIYCFWATYSGVTIWFKVPYVSTRNKILINRCTGLRNSKRIRVQGLYLVKGLGCACHGGTLVLWGSFPKTGASPFPWVGKSRHAVEKINCSSPKMYGCCRSC